MSGIERDNLRAQEAVPRDYACPVLGESRLRRLPDLIRNTGSVTPPRKLCTDAVLEVSEVRNEGNSLPLWTSGE